MIRALFLAGVLLSPLAAQPPVGAFRGQTVGFDEYLTFLGLTYRGEPLGRELLTELRDRELVAAAAARLGVSATDAEVEGAYRRLARRLEEATRGKEHLAAVLRRRGLGRARFRAALRRLVLLRKIIRRERGLAPDTPVADGDARRWLRSRARRVGVVTDPAALPPGAILKVGERVLPAAALGRLVHEALTPQQRARAVDRLLRCRLVARLLARRGLRVTGEELEAALRRRPPERRALLRDDPTFRARVGLEKLGRHLFTRAQVERYYAAHQDRFGPTVRLARIFVRVRRPRAPFQGRPREEAGRLIRSLRARLQAGASFAQLARRYSDHPSRFRGGDVGWVHRRGDLEPALADAAFALEVGEISEILETPAGFHLLRVAARRPAPPLRRVATEIRAAMTAAWLDEEIRRAEFRNRFAGRS